MIETTLDGLLGGYEAVFLDVYGVLLTTSGPLPGAARLLARLRDAGMPFWLVTNDASKLPEATVVRLAACGMSVVPEQIVTSGSLLTPYFAQHGLAGSRTLVLGPADSQIYAERAGGQVLPLGTDAPFDVLAICDEAGYPFLETLDATLTTLYRQLDAGQGVHLVLPNPDLVYHQAADRFGFAAGSMALMFEAALARRYPGRDLRFTPLGKPEAPIFEEACRRAGTRRAIMVGDQLQTDIAGARAFGLDAALVAGVTRPEDATAGEHAPTYLLHLDGVR